MGKVGRFACIATPVALTVATLICIIIVGLGGTNKNLNVKNQFYFFKADTSQFTATPKADLIDGIKVDDKVLEDVFKKVETTLDLKDFYTVSLWNYCEGVIKDNSPHVDSCSKPRAQYWFDPVQVWGLDTTGTENAIPKNLRTALSTYKTVTKWMFIAYVIAFVATCVELILGFLAIFSRWGSFVTTLAAGVSAFFILVASSMATAIYATVSGSFNTALRPYGIQGSLGRNMYATTWLAVVFAWAAALFWTISICCCSGRSTGKSTKTKAAKTPYTYEMLGGAFAAQQPHPGMSRGSPMPLNHNNNALHGNNAYEPYRHNVV